METLSVVQSLLIALWVAAVMSRWLGGGATLTLRFSPLMTGLVVGLIMGEVAQAMIVTAALQMIYMGFFLQEDQCQLNHLLQQLSQYQSHY
ncbi:PTS system IIC component [Enterococcus faecium]|nr:PTS system IIC component [Enterococcus faecium]